MRKVLITGGYGFIGSNLVRHWLQKHPDDLVLNLDALTYAARPRWVDEYLETTKRTAERHEHIHINVQDQSAVSRLMRMYEPDDVLHLAAESHVCRSIAGPRDFVHTNIVGTFNLLEEFRLSKKGMNGGRFVYVSTDEVFGELDLDEPPFHEDLPLVPRSPYAASKAAGDLLVLAYCETYGLNASVTNCSNNFGPNQNEEKLIARVISKFMKREPMTIYGPGTQIRDWLHVDDHCSALDHVLHGGAAGERYCIGGEMELMNITLIQKVQIILEDITGRPTPHSKHTSDRPTDDQRYAVDTRKMRALFKWAPRAAEFDSLLRETVVWYFQHEHKMNSGAV